MVALNAFSQSSGILKSNLVISDSICISEKDKTVFTIFNFKNGGHIVVSNTDCSEPVLGYGLKSQLSIENLNPALQILFNNYKEELIYISEKEIPQHELIKQKWENYTKEDFNSLKSYTVGSILLETEWDQDKGYQASCPNWPGTQTKCKVGCGGVALGQILYYWGCRVFQDGTVKYLPENFQDSIHIDFFDQTYSWDAMDINSPDSYNTKLLYHSAVSLESDFGTSETVHDANMVWWSLRRNWGFNSGTLEHKDASSNWTNILRNEIDNERPVYYGGFNYSNNDSSAHAWVVDGYRTLDNKFHCNWGWGGSYDDWYTLSDLTPGSHNFNSNQFAIMDIYPKLDGCDAPMGESVICHPDTIEYSVTIPSTASVSWSVGGCATQVGGNTGTTYSICSTTANAESGTVTATIKNSQGGTFMLRSDSVVINPPLYTDVWLNVYKSTGGQPTKVNGNWLLCPNTHYHIYLMNDDGSCSLSNYTWSLPSNWSVNYYYNNMVSIYTNSIAGGMIEVYANTCCSVNRKVLTDYVFQDYSCGGYYMYFTPNPTSGETVLTLGVTSEDMVFDIDEEWDLEIYNNSQILKEKKIKLKGNEYLIKTSGWKAGVYFIRVKYKDQILSEKLVKK